MLLIALKDEISLRKCLEKIDDTVSVFSLDGGYLIETYSKGFDTSSIEGVLYTSDEIVSNGAKLIELDYGYSEFVEEVTIEESEIEEFIDKSVVELLQFFRDKKWRFFKKELGL